MHQFSKKMMKSLEMAVSYQLEKHQKLSVLAGSVAGWCLLESHTLVS